MKKLNIFLCLLFISMQSCNYKSGESIQDTTLIDPITNAVIETSVLYEVNIRQYSKEGTFSAFSKDIPELKTLGVKIIWLMPIFPISETKRKATGGEFANLIQDTVVRDRMLGSYYAVSDYTKVNTEFGSIEDFRHLINEAHKNDMYVILDWVPNHTGWDHSWITSNPEYYTQDKNGNIIDPINPDTGESWGWQDVADLDYTNFEMRDQMLSDMKYWVEKENIDGFRCDVAGAVPLDFWESTIKELRSKKSLFMLAEAHESELVKGSHLFDMVYGWDRHHTFNKMAKSEKAPELWRESIGKDLSRYEVDDILMNFVTNHDENSWNGTVRERLSDASEVLTALSFLAPGMPLIYSGQEYDLDHRLLFFEKDQIPKEKKLMWPLLENLAKLKNNNPALNGGKNPAMYENIDLTNSKVLAFNRVKNKNKVTFVANFSNSVQAVNNPSFGSKDYITNIPENDNILNLSPWSFRILIKN